MKKRKGTVPKDANGIIAESEQGWAIYRRATSAGDWLSLKVVHAELVEGAANYWLGWNHVKRCFARTSDVVRMQAGNPDLLAWVEDALREIYPTLSEADMALDA